MKRPRRRSPLVYALYLNAAALFAILAVLLSRGGSSTLPSAFGATPAVAAGNGIYVMPAQMLDRYYGCYVLDTERQTLCAYAFYGNSSRPEPRLIAARGISQDRQLTNFNTGPDPEEIKKLIQMGQQPLRGYRPALPSAGPTTNSDKPEPQADTQQSTKEPAQ